MRPPIRPSIHKWSHAASGASVLVSAVIPKFAAQAIRKVSDLGWKPTFFLSMTGNSVGAVMRPAGPEKGVGIISASFYKDPTDEQWQGTPDYKEWLAWMKKYNTSGNITDAFAVMAIVPRRPWSLCSGPAATT